MSSSVLFIDIDTIYKVKIWSKNYMILWYPFPDTSLTVKRTKILVKIMWLISILVFLTVNEVSGNGLYETCNF